MIVMYRRLNKQRSIFTSSQALMKAIYLDYKKFEIGGAKSVKRLVLECISKLGVYIIEAIYFTSVCRNR